jgi:hypothetical protein
VRAKTTTPNNESDIITLENEKGTCQLKGIAISGENVMKKEAENILRHKDLTIETGHVECKNKCGTSHNRGNWNYLNIIQKIPEQHNGEAQNQGTTENSHTGHCTCTLEINGVKVQYSRFNIGNSVICTMTYNYRIAATLNSLETWFVSIIQPQIQNDK